MAVTLHARVPVYGCDGTKCKPWYTTPLASFLDARTGTQIEARTINGWKSQLPPVVGASSAPPLGTDLRLTTHVPCGGHRVDRRTLRRFHGVTAVTCFSGMRTYPGQGQWEVLVRKVAVGSVSGVQRYYEKPDQLDQPPKGTMCSDVLVGFPVATFVDAQGHWETPARWPIDRCHQPLGYPPSIRWHVVRMRRIRQLVSAPALAAHCAMRVGNTVAWAGPPRDSTGGPLFDVPPWRTHVCIYRTPPDNFATGRFVRGFRLDVSQTRRLVGHSPVRDRGAAVRSSACSQRSARASATRRQLSWEVAGASSGPIASPAPRTGPWRGRFSAEARRNRARESTRPPRCRPRPGPARARRRDRSARTALDCGSLPSARRRA